MIKEAYKVELVNKYEIRDWLLKKHYAHRLPSISYAYGLFDKNNLLQGVCTFGMPARMMNSGECLFKDDFKVETLELNRLVLEEEVGKNGESYFISHSLNLLPKPMCLVSYADSNFGHHGYIYQATNWLYTGLTPPRAKFVDIKGEDIHERTIWSRYGSEENALSSGEIKKVTQEGKHRYFYFLGSKKQVKEMKSKFLYTQCPYPKGDNKRYDASFEADKQERLF